MALPNFLIAGAPKAGTTALHVALARHPQLYLSRVKEPKYFLTDGRPRAQGGPGDAKTLKEQVWERDKYEALFADAPPGTLLGESTSLYLQDPDALRRIRTAVPDVRIIALLRDPVDRAHSNWAHLWSAGLEPEHDFVKACLLEQRRTAAGWAPFWRYLSLGKYGEQLDQLWTLFPREQTLVLRYRELRDHRPRPSTSSPGSSVSGPGWSTETTAENVTTHASRSLVNKSVARVLRAGSSLESQLPGPLSRGMAPANQFRPAIYSASTGAQATHPSTRRADSEYTKDVHFSSG